MDRLRRVPRPAWIGAAFVAGIAAGLCVTWLAVGAVGPPTLHRDAAPGGPPIHAPRGPIGHGGTYH